MSAKSLAGDSLPTGYRQPPHLNCCEYTLSAAMKSQLAADASVDFVDQYNEQNQRVHGFRILSATGIPHPGTDFKVLGRECRVALVNTQHVVVSNVHTLPVRVDLKKSKRKWKMSSLRAPRSAGHFVRYI